MQSTRQIQSGRISRKSRDNQGGRTAPVVAPAISTNGGDGALVVPTTRHFNEIDLARRWRLSPPTVQAWRMKGLGPRYVKLVGRVLYRLADIETFETEHLWGGR